MPGSNVDTPDMREQMDLWNQMLPMLQQAGLIDLDANPGALEEFNKAQQAQVAAWNKRRGQEIGQRTGDFQGKIVSALKQRGMGNAMATEMARKYGGEYAGTIPNVGSQNYNQFFGSGAQDQVMSSVEKALQDRMQNRLKSVMPADYARTAWADTADDKAISQILAQQQQEARVNIDRARDRGTLDDRGYQSALAELDKQSRGASTRLSDIGSGIISGYRTDLGGLSDTLRTEQMADVYGNAYRPMTGVRDALTGRINEQQGRLTGDIRNAMGSTPLFDTNALVQKGGAQQGYINPWAQKSSSTLTRAIKDRNTANAGARGVGSRGVF